MVSEAKLQKQYPNMSFLGLPVESDFLYYINLSVGFLCHLDAKWHSYILKSEKYIIVFMFHPDNVQHLIVPILVL